MTLEVINTSLIYLSVVQSLSYSCSSLHPYLLYIHQHTIIE